VKPNTELHVTQHNHKAADMKAFLSYVKINIKDELTVSTGQRRPITQPSKVTATVSREKQSMKAKNTIHKY